MRLFISWSGEDSKAIAAAFREWLPLINKDVKPYMSSEDIEKGQHWPSRLRNELSATSFGLVILTPQNKAAEWLHFEAGAIAKSVEEGQLVSILCGLKQSDIKQPLALFQNASFDRDDILRVVRAINSAAGEEATDERLLERTFEAFWPQLSNAVHPLLERIGKSKPHPPAQQLESDKILQELLLLSRQQMRILSSPEELIGREILSLLSSIMEDAEGTAARLNANERSLALALTARWDSFSGNLSRYIVLQEATTQRDNVGRELARYSRYVTEFRNRLTASDKSQAIAHIVDEIAARRKVGEQK